ncbi:Peptidase family M28 [Bacteroides luti]|uniref:Peptidase family M28 n=1 Tax=Bacteroides luti TaxID=1297750 RepID=A0A1M5H5E3_9BACE|nr:M20/M25/M40 family metallo-hydrolase [Bacteroides luti]SHG11230.1 Peptidase family M28 [Bacteroides luti]
MKKIIIAALLIAANLSVLAQKPIEKGLQSISEQSAKASINFLASDELEGREAGSRGGRVAGEYIVSMLRMMNLSPLGDSYYQPFEACHNQVAQKGKWQVHPDSIAQLKKGVYKHLQLNNILAKIEGKRTDEYVIVGAHYDHLGIDPTLAGDCIYNGADDNASGVSAVLQLAKAFLASGQQPERTIIFAFWDGEEKGLLGSSYFVQNCSFINSVKGYLNYDMIGRNSNEAKPQLVDYFYTEANAAFGEWLKNDIKKYKLKLEPIYHPWDKPVGGSDNGSFAKAGVPIIWYHTNAHPDYHQPSDHASRINWEKVVEITKASFLNLWNLANEKSY